MIPECDESIAIARELRGAYSEALNDPKARDRYSPIEEMIEGMIEEDGERLEGAFEKFLRWPAEEISQPESTDTSRPSQAGLENTKSRKCLTRSSR